MIGFPLLLIPLAIVNIVVFLLGVRLDRLQEPVVTVGLPSLQSWTITFSDVLLAFGLLLLFFEVVKSARPGAKYVTDHLLSFIVFAAAAAEFLLLPEFAHSTFFLLMLMAFTDVIAGITIRAVRPKPVAARAAPPVDERPVSRPVAPEPAPPPPPRAEPVESRVVEPQPNEMPATAEQRDLPIAPNQEILPPEPTGPRR
jgi:outer membrane biosynthesis protein TonB